MRDREYITRYQAGDFDAFGVLYERYIDKIFAYIYRKTSDRQEAEDLTSQVWMKVLKSLEFFGERKNAGFSGWLYCIANNTVIDHYRAKKEKIDIESIAEPWISPDLAKHVDDKKTLKRVIKYLDTLKPLEKEIVTLRIWDDLSYKDIAHICGKKEDNCKKIFSRSLQKIVANVSLIFVIIILL